MADEIQTDSANGGITPEPATNEQDAPRLPARFDRVDWLGFAATTLIAMAGYLFTVAPNVTLEWSGIISTSAMYGGVAPPPGYPVWTLYSWCFIKLLPFSNIAWRVAVGSAVASACACGLVAMMISRGALVLLHGTTLLASLKARELVSLRLVCCTVAGLILAFSGVVWNYAVIAETRALSLLMFTGILAFMLRWMLAPNQRRFLFGAIFAFGLLLSNSQEMLVALPGLLGAIMLAEPRTGRDVTLLVLPLAIYLEPETQYNLWLDDSWNPNIPLVGVVCVVALTCAALIAVTRRVGTEWRSALASGLALMLGFGFYLYLPIASMTTPPVNWGYARTVEGYMHVIGLGQYERLSPTPLSEPVRYAAQLGGLATSGSKQFGWLYLLLSFVPFCLAHRMCSLGRRWLFGLLAVWFGVVLVLLAELNPPPDRQAWEQLGRYFFAGYAVHAIWLGLGLIIIGAKIARPRESARPQP